MRETGCPSTLCHATNVGGMYVPPKMAGNYCTICNVYYKIRVIISIVP